MLQLLSTARFVLRKRLGHGTGGACAGMHDLPVATPSGDEVFLFHLGYRAPGPYEVLVTSAPQVGWPSRREWCTWLLQRLHVESMLRPFAGEYQLRY
jgi:hypothetical protein